MSRDGHRWLGIGAARPYYMERRASGPSPSVDGELSRGDACMGRSESGFCFDESSAGPYDRSRPLLAATHQSVRKARRKDLRWMYST